MSLQQKIPILSRAAVASYDYVDLDDGLGYVNYFLAIAVSGAGETNILTRQSLYSGKIETTTTGTTEVNFDTITFNTGKVVKGTAYFSIPIRVITTGTGTITAELIKVTAGTESSLGSAVASAAVAVAANGEMLLLALPLTETVIKPDDFLRLEVIITHSGGGTSYMGHDPKDRDGAQLLPSSDTTISNASHILIPFRLNT